MSTRDHLLQDALKLSRSLIGLAVNAQKELSQKTYSLSKKILPRFGFVTHEEMEATKAMLEKQIADLKEQLLQRKEQQFKEDDF